MICWICLLQADQVIKKNREKYVCIHMQVYTRREQRE